MGKPLLDKNRFQRERGGQYWQGDLLARKLQVEEK